MLWFEDDEEGKKEVATQLPALVFSLFNCCCILLHFPCLPAASCQNGAIIVTTSCITGILDYYYDYNYDY